MALISVGQCDRQALLIPTRPSVSVSKPMAVLTEREYRVLCYGYDQRLMLSAYGEKMKE